ncbi:MAG: hypothetical protein HZA78_12090 [Candidatus Schekmanbacteria bacterium]|nr:hypothetical protein [Candidatus Schekmanbacteria bacterium]
MDVNPLKTAKIASKVCFYLANGIKMVATLHLPPNTRMIETLNMHFAQKPYLPITDVKIICPDGKEEKYDFIALNKSHILFCFPILLKSYKTGGQPKDEAKEVEADKVEEPEKVEAKTEKNDVIALTNLSWLNDTALAASS